MKNQGTEPIPGFNEITSEFGEVYEEAGLSLEVYGRENEKEITEVALLDQEIFGEHKSLPKEGFMRIVENGGYVLGVRDRGGRLLAEASLVLNNNPESGDSQLERQLPDYMAYCDGAAVHQSQRKKGIQKWLLRSRESKAAEAGKTVMSASVRHRNIPSIKSMLKEGYVVVCDAPHYYGEGAEDSRILLVKVMEEANPMDALRADEEGIDFEHRGVTGLKDIDLAISEREDIISLEFQYSDEVDESFNGGVAKLLRSGYVGVSCHDVDIGDSDGERSSVLVFVRRDTVAGGPFDIIARIQDDLHNEVFV